MQKNKILIIGTLPPPIGGVTTHVKRLIENLEIYNINYNFISLSIKNLLVLPFILPRYKAIHLHSSNLYVQNWVISICTFFNVKSIVTFHGNLLRYNKKDLSRVGKIVKKSTFPIVLNIESYRLARTLNANTLKVSSFIPPVKIDSLDKRIISTINDLKKQYKRIFCTSATGITYDVFNNEIYGVLDLIKAFGNYKDYALIVCDSSSEYKKYIIDNNIQLSKNVILISQPHSMYEVLKIADGLIRNTSTDGDSIAIKESLFLNKITIATDTVGRPCGVLLFKRNDFVRLRQILESDIPADISCEISNGVNELINLYSKIQ